MFHRLRAALAALAACVACSAAAADLPNPIRLIVPFPAGGGADTLARIAAAGLTERLGVRVWIENRAGAGGTVGQAVAARAPADGSTLVYVTNGTQGANPTLYPELTFDANRDFEPVCRMTRIALVMVVNPKVADVKTPAELAAWARRQPGAANFASSGVGTSSHLAGALATKRLAAPMTHVPYRGGAFAMRELVAGQTAWMIEVAPNALPQVEAGNLRALGVAGKKRSAVCPDVPTLAEAGLPGIDLAAWDGLAAPKGTPPEMLDKVAEAMAGVLADPATVKRLKSLGATPDWCGPAEFGRFWFEEERKWGGIARAATRPD